MGSPDSFRQLRNHKCLFHMEIQVRVQQTDKDLELRHWLQLTMRE